MTWEAIAAFTGIGLTVLGAFFYSIRKLTSMEFSLKETGQMRHENTIQELKKTRADFAETVRAIREHADLAHRRLDQVTIKIQEVELYIRDHYIEDPTFQSAMTKLEEEMRGLGGKIDKMFESELERLRRRD